METALLQILKDIYRATGGKNITLLVVLDILAAFNTLDIPMIMCRLEYSISLSGTSKDQEIFDNETVLNL